MGWSEWYDIPYTHFDEDPECSLEGCTDGRPHYHRGDLSEKVLLPDDN